MRRLAIILAGLLTAASVACGQDAASPIRYTVSLPTPQTQMVEMSIEVRQVDAPVIEFALPVWRPGKYQVLDLAGGIRDVKARNARREPLGVEKIDKSTWRVSTGGSPIVRLDYRVYCNSLGERTRHVDDSHAFLSPAAAFMYIPQRRHHPVQVHVDLPPNSDGWRIATGLEALPADPLTLTAPNYDVLVDSPLEVGIHDLIEFEVRGKPHQIAIWGEAEYDAEKLKGDFAKIIEEQAAIFGGLPYERYVFITHIGAGASGGTEHLNSTVIQASRKALEDKDTYPRFLGLVSHEMFHTWNVKQFRPADIHPYDYQRENYSTLFWVVEGATSYYDELTLVRVGIKKPDKYLDELGEAIDALRNRPGDRVQSLQESSFDAWIKFNKPTADSVNSTVSFYDKGALVSLLLDLTMRQTGGEGSSLDSVMRSLFERFPLDRVGYAEADFLALVQEHSGAEFDEFFEQYVQGTEPMDFDAAFDAVGLELHFKAKKPDDDSDESDDGDDDADEDAATQPSASAPDEAPPEDEVPEAEPDEPAEAAATAYLGLNLSDDGGRTVVSSVLADGPAYHAGILAGDQVLALDGRRLSAADLSDRLKMFKPGDSIVLTIFRRDLLRAITLTLTGRPDGAWEVRRVKEPTDQQKAAYEAWLGQKWPAKD